MKADPRRVRGQKKMAQIAQIPAIDPPDDFVATTIDRVFGELWQRPGLSDRERHKIVVAAVFL